MCHSNKLAILFGTMIAVMVVLALIFAVSWGRNSALMPDNTPAGTVQRFLIALQQKDNAQAAKYLSPSSSPNIGEAPKAIFGNPQMIGLPSSYYASSTWKAIVRNVTESGDKASVNVIFEISTSAQPFGSQVFSNYVTYELTHRDQFWLITSEGFSIQ
jgi:hypothetical protein